jgi:phosphoribosylamine---glycine ligase
MKFLLISKCGEGAGILSKIKDEGNDVRMYIKEKDYKSVYKGIIDQIHLGSSWIDKDTIVILDSSGMGKIADEFRNTNAILGGSSFHDKMEYDRTFGLDLMQNCGIKVPETTEFSNTEWNLYEEFLQTQKNKKFVFKPDGDLPSRLSYVPSDTEDLIGYMEFAKKFYGSKIKSFILQEFIEGTIISTEYWCNGKEFIGPVNHTVEEKKFMNGNLGPSTGCSGNLVWLGDEKSEIVQCGVLCAEKELVKENYIGPIDLNTIFNDSGVYGLEWTPRFGLDAFPTFMQLLQIDIAEFISGIAKGTLKEIPLRDNFAGGIRVSIPPYPLEPNKATEVQEVSPNYGLPIRGLPKNLENFYFYEIMKDEENYFHSEGTGVIAVISDYWSDCESCFDLPYELLENLKIPDKQYRTDLDQVLPKMYEDVKEKMEVLY